MILPQKAGTIKQGENIVSFNLAVRPHSSSFARWESSISLRSACPAMTTIPLVIRVASRNHMAANFVAIG